MLQATFDLSNHPTMETIQLLSSLLDRMTTANDQLAKAARSTRCMSLPASSGGSGGVSASSCSPGVGSYTRFHARSIPSIDILSYLSRILKYCPCSNECFLSLLIYFDRMAKNALALTGQPFTIDSYNIHRLIITGVMVASKFFSDVFYTNTRYAKVGGLLVTELNALELEFLKLNRFNLWISVAELQRYGDQLLKIGLMEQEMRKNILCDATSLRHARSTSLGSNVVLRSGSDALTGQHHRRSSDQSADRLSDMMGRVSLDENDASMGGGAMGRTMPFYSHGAYGQQASTYHPLSQHGSDKKTRRMSSISNLNQLYSPHRFPSPKEMRHSPVALVAEDGCNKRAPSNGQDDGPPRPQDSKQTSRPRHGSVGGMTPGHANVSYACPPRQSRSSANLHQQFTMWKPIHPSQNMMMSDKAKPTSHPPSLSHASMRCAPPERRLSVSSIQAPPFIPHHAGGVGATATAAAATAAIDDPLNFHGPFVYNHFTLAPPPHPPLGIPTPPSSSSPVDQKSSMPSSHYTPNQLYPVMYL
ncbi:cyclin-domain-containing protein [Radiomyces spectabilis]|uniref:cyclin-domain-containing protein n=1 Tax=Radiomyces spectabilis TaxID=64574 RepID=UPI00221ED043|nr:cyclin-domain-containing protein [Radiomyces spectabilis]KAI8390888.1 cyclin-domain-containing protein [Radiomyces spectabilis]